MAPSRDERREFQAIPDEYHLFLGYSEPPRSAPRLTPPPQGIASNVSSEGFYAVDAIPDGLPFDGQNYHPVSYSFEPQRGVDGPFVTSPSSHFDPIALRTATSYTGPESSAFQNSYPAHTSDWSSHLVQSGSSQLLPHFYQSSAPTYWPFGLGYTTSYLTTAYTPTNAHAGAELSTPANGQLGQENIGCLFSSFQPSRSSGSPQNGNSLAEPPTTFPPSTSSAPPRLGSRANPITFETEVIEISSESEPETETESCASSPGPDTPLVTLEPPQPPHTEPFDPPIKIESSEDLWTDAQSASTLPGQAGYSVGEVTANSSTLYPGVLDKDIYWLVENNRIPPDAEVVPIPDSITYEEHRETQLQRGEKFHRPLDYPKGSDYINEMVKPGGHQAFKPMDNIYASHRSQRTYGSSRRPQSRGVQRFEDTFLTESFLSPPSATKKKKKSAVVDLSMDDDSIESTDPKSHRARPGSPSSSRSYFNAYTKTTGEKESAFRNVNNFIESGQKVASRFSAGLTQEEIHEERDSRHSPQVRTQVRSPTKPIGRNRINHSTHAHPPQPPSPSHRMSNAFKRLQPQQDIPSSTDDQYTEFWPLKHAASHQFKADRGPFILALAKTGKDNVFQIIHEHGTGKPQTIGFLDLGRVLKCVTDEEACIRFTGSRHEDIGATYWADIEFSKPYDFSTFWKTYVQTLRLLTRSRKSTQAMHELFRKPLAYAKCKEASAGAEGQENALLQHRPVSNDQTIHHRNIRGVGLLSQGKPETSKVDAGMLGDDIESHDVVAVDPVCTTFSKTSRPLRATRSTKITAVDLEKNSDEPYSVVKGLGPVWKTAVSLKVVESLTSKRPRTATVPHADLVKLDDGEFLNDAILEFYIVYLLRNMTRSGKRVKVLSSFHYSKFVNDGYEAGYKKPSGVGTWTKNDDIFGYDYVVVPVNEHTHWYLAIICNVSNFSRTPLQDELSGKDASLSANNAKQSASDEPIMLIDDGAVTVNAREKAIVHNETSEYTDAPRGILENLDPVKPTTTMKTPAKHKPKAGLRPPRNPDEPIILILDSMNGSRGETVKTIERWLAMEAKEKRHMEAQINQPFYKLPPRMIPNQPNAYDCGIYLLAYLEKFMQDPQEFVRKVLSNEMNAKTDWKEMNALKMRGAVRDLLFARHKEMEEERIAEKVAKKAAKQAARESLKRQREEPAVEELAEPETKKVKEAHSTPSRKRARDDTMEEQVAPSPKRSKEHHVSPPNKRSHDEVVEETPEFSPKRIKSTHESASKKRSRDECEDGILGAKKLRRGSSQSLADAGSPQNPISLSDEEQ